MTWDSFRQRVRYLRGEALGNWPASIANVVLQPIPADGSAGVHVWCIGSVPAHGMRRGSLLHCTVPAIADTTELTESSIKVPVASLRGVWMDPDCHATMDCESLALLRYLQTAAIERLLWNDNSGMVILADKGRRWIEGRVDGGEFPADPTVRALFTDCSVADAQTETPEAAEQLRENDWYYERGGRGGRFVAFSRSSNVVVYDTATKRETQVTWAVAEGVQYGAVDVSMEEELGRTTGIFWAAPAEAIDSSPPNARVVDRMLCARVDESQVMSVGLPELPPALASNKADSSANTIGEPGTLFSDARYRWDAGCAWGVADQTTGFLTDFQKYSRPGTPGAITDWVIVEIEHTERDGIVRQRVRPLHERFRLATLFPWCEYVVRAGWIPPGSSSTGGAVWLQLLDRAQKRTAIVRVPLGCFAPGVDQAFDPLDQVSSGLRQASTPPPPPAPNAHVDVLYEEEQPDAWINVNHALRFLDDPPAHNAVRFILASERTGGFSHLHLVTAYISPPSSPSGAAHVWHARQEIVPLTGGKWPVTDDAPVFVDEARQLVYFSARRPNPLTTNLFAASYDSSTSGCDKLWQLTCGGYTHSHFAFDRSGSFFYCQSSNVATPVRHCVYMIQHSSSEQGYHRQSVPRQPPLHGMRDSLDECLSDSMSFYSAACEPPERDVRGRCLCVLEISSAALLRSHPLISPDPAAGGLRRLSSIRKPAQCRLSVCSSSSSSLISLASQSQSVDSIASDEMFVERLLSKLRTSGQSIQHSTLAADLMKLKRLTPAYVSQRVTKAVRSALPFCSTPTIIPRHLLHSSLLRGSSRAMQQTPGKEPLAGPPAAHVIQKSDPAAIASQEGCAVPLWFASSLTSATRTFATRETLLGIDKPMQHGGGGDPVPRLFCVPVPRRSDSSADRDGGYELVFGHVYLPPDFKPGKRYPTVVNAYGGPQCQLVTNAYPYPRHRRLAMLTRMTPAVAKPGTVPEFVPHGDDVEDHLLQEDRASDVRAIVGMDAPVVVCVDGRGTPHRGLGFEAAIRGKLGRLEVDDIVSALEYLCAYGLACLDPVQGAPPVWCQHTMSATTDDASHWEDHLLRPPVFAPPGGGASCTCDPGPRDPVPFIDRSSVAIHGWSYGGYVALRALARYPDWFRVAIAGAPVVRWDWYSSAYIERYLGVLTEASSQAYADASVASVADQLLPSARQRGRILVVHGWNDDNVHVAHTAALVRELAARGSGAEHLCVYANERHGLRLPSSNEHFETMLSFWLFHFLQGSS